jgi:hypothetical protein
MGSSLSTARGSSAPASGISPPSGSIEGPVDAACRFLRDEVVPTLESERHRALQDAVERAVDARRLEPLHELSVHEKRELLELLERRVEAARRAPDPRAIVRLTSVLSTAPALEGPLARSLASPAR